MRPALPRHDAALSLAALTALAAFAGAPPLRADEPVDLVAITQIRDEGFNRSKVMETLSEMTDGVGPRLTGSPNMKKAGDWAKKKFTEWGLANVHTESYAPLVRSWTWEHASLTLLTPQRLSITAIPRAWTPGTHGPLKGTPVFAPFDFRKDTEEPEKWAEKWKGKLEGKIVLLSPLPEPKPHEKPDSKRESKESLQEIFRFETGGGDYEPPVEKMIQWVKRGESLRKALEAEKVAAVIDGSGVDDGTIRVDGTYSCRKGDGSYPPSVVIPKESYGRLARLLERKADVEVELDVKAALGDDDPDAEINTLAEIPGSDPKLKDEVVMLGAHFDSWHGGTGATDNGTGSAAVMEAIRLIKAAGLKPRRTIRVALWSGEEQGLYGSWAYVTKHFATRPETTDPDHLLLWPQARKFGGPLSVLPEHAKLAAYFNLDNGAGKIRGVYTQENTAVKPIFEAWLAPLHDLGATTVTARNTGGTDHLSFDTVGLPGFQFIQDPLDYGSRTHHTDMDTYERAPRSDMMQNAVVLATFAYEAAMRDEKLPRKPLPVYRPDDKKEEKKAEAKGGK